MSRIDHLAVAKEPTATLNDFSLADLAQFKREGSFPQTDSKDFRVFYVGRDDVHGILKYLLARCSRALKLNQFGYDDEELDEIIQHLVRNEHVFVQGTLDRSQAGGVHEKRILAAWDPAMRNSFAIGQSATHQISHTKGGVIDGLVAYEGSTNWSASGEGTIVAADGSDVGRRSQNNTLTVYVNPIELSVFSSELDEEHAVALRQQISKASSASPSPPAGD